MALNFDGTTGQVAYGAIAELERPPAFTVMWWMNPAVVGVSDRICQYGSPGVNGFLVRCNATTAATLQIFINGASGNNWASFLIVDTLFHVAVVYNEDEATDAEKLRVYKNGVFVPATVLGIIPDILTSTVDNFLFHTDVAGVELDSTDSHVRVWNRALAAREVANEMQAYFARARANLLLDCPYDDGLLARDYSGNGHHGTVTGAIPAPGPPISYGGSS